MFHCTYLVPMPTVCFIRRFFFRYWSSHVFPWTAMFFMVGILLLFLYAFESIRSSHGLKSSAFGRRPQKFGVIFHLFWHLLSKSADLSKQLEDNCEILWSSQKSWTLSQTKEFRKTQAPLCLSLIIAFVCLQTAARNKLLCDCGSWVQTSPSTNSYI